MKQLYHNFILICLLSLISSASFADGVKIDGIYYTFNEKDKTATVTKGASGYGNSSYLGSVIIPSEVTYNNKLYSVTSIGDNAFNWCSNLTSVTIPEGVTSIGIGSFDQCSGLTSITIPKSVTTIGEYAFYSCSNLISVTSYITYPFTLTWKYPCFSQIHSDATLYVPYGTTNLYEKFGWTQYFAHVVEMESQLSNIAEYGDAEGDITARYDMQGRRISRPAKGINILKMSDGSTRKVMVK